MAGGFYLQWKYPNTSRNLSKFIFICLIIYVAVYFLFIATTAKTIRRTDLKSFNGLVEYFEIPLTNDKQSATFKLKSQPMQFSFDMSGYSGSELIGNGDSVSILASSTEMPMNIASIPSYELKKGDIFIFSLDKYNSTVLDDLRLARIFLWIAICFVALYFIIEITRLRAWIKKQLSSDDTNFQATKPNFNEFLDR